MKQGFDAHDYQCFELFGGEKALYEIPPYQRPYSWEKKHVTQLMEDLIDAYREWKSAEDEPNSQINNGRDSSYYLGSVIVVGDDRDRESRLEILDGQQRITTLTILYAVLDHRYDISPSASRNNSVSVRVKDHTRDEWRLETRANADFRQTVLETLDLEADNRYVESANYIINCIEDEFDDLPDELNDFQTYLDDRVHMVRIRTGQVQEAVRIFQTINTRGKDLTLTDKVKSYLLSHVTEDDEDDFVEVWKEIVNKLDGDYSLLDDILGWYRFYLTESEVDVTAYDDLVEELDESKPIGAIRNIRDFVDEYRASVSDADKWTFMLENHGQERYWQTILIAARMENIDNLLDLKKYLVQFYYSYMIGGHYRSKTKSPSREILKIIKQSDGVKQAKEYIEGEREDLRIASKVSDGLTSENVYDENWHEDLLVAIEYQLSNNRKVERIPTGSDLHIEHILPKSWNSENIDHNYWTSRFTEEQAESLKHTIGNLIPLQYDLNESAGQRPFHDKVEIYRGNRDYPKSAFDLVDAVSDGQYDEWSPSEIRKHRDYMIKETATLLDLPEDELLPDDD